MTLWSVDFPDLYARHLCRHSQLGINVIHLIALFGVWFGVYATVHWLTDAWWLPIALAAGYLGLVALNAPLRVILATAGFLAVFIAAVLSVPANLPWWMLCVYLVMIPACYQLQNFSHKIYTRETDMTEFNLHIRRGACCFSCC